MVMFSMTVLNIRNIVTRPRPGGRAPSSTPTRCTAHEMHANATKLAKLYPISHLTSLQSLRSPARLHPHHPQPIRMNPRIPLLRRARSWRERRLLIRRQPSIRLLLRHRERRHAVWHWVRGGRWEWREWGSGWREGGSERRGGGRLGWVGAGGCCGEGRVVWRTVNTGPRSNNI